MNYLLDTHTLIWSLTENKKLSKIVKNILENTDNEIYVSAISFWEVSLKYALKKLSLNGINPEELLELTTELGFNFISIQPDECADFYKMNNLIHRDPFDRMLIWQALKHDFILITKDDTVKRYQSMGLKLIW
ncbi:MAG: type II toxin-antitoxin system VapC family toxin [Sphingobacteriaceae bacterium]|nr:MAG: type II toxin-antitoxin system VapC family toxin [Sphingobacteriaceae bacterium]